MEHVKAELSAMVWKIVVAEGDTVAEGQELIILESMKMEIPVEAECSGTIVRIQVAEGQAVAEGDVLVEIEV